MITTDSHATYKSGACGGLKAFFLVLDGARGTIFIGWEPMSMSPKQRAIMLRKTKEQAAALLDDIQYLRDLSVSRDQSPAELRRVSSVLRRLLIDRDITDVAAPRLGRFMFCAPNNNPFYAAADKIPFSFFGSGGMEVFGVKFRSAILDLRSPTPRPPDYVDTMRTVELPLDGFLKQRVLCLEGQWVGRRDVIKYIANVASGVHSGTRATPLDETIWQIRHVAGYRKKDGSLSVAFNLDALALPDDDMPFRYSPEMIDPVLLEILATVHYLLISKDTKRLEVIIAAELGPTTATR